MTASLPRLQRPSRRADGRVLLKVLSSALDPDRPLIANLVVTRRCNLACGYCHEYDRVSPPVPLAVLRERIDHLKRLRTVFVTLTGGESLLHPDIVEVVAYVRAQGMTPFLNTNAYLLTLAHIEALDAAGLYGMQISIDNVTPNAMTVKSLKLVLPKLKLLAQHARFHVRINTVLGSGPPAETVEVTRVVRALGFDASCSLMRLGSGELAPLDAEALAAYDEIRRLGQRAHALLADDFQAELVATGEVAWKCRAGARTFHVCEDGLVHLCAPRSGNPGKPIATYDETDIRAAFHAPKPCASKCPVAYAHHVSRLDKYRAQDGAPMVFSNPDPTLVPLRRSA